MIRTVAAALALVFVFAAYAQDKPKAAILKAPGPIAIDGKLNERAWELANTYQIDWVFGGKENGKLSESPRGTVQYSWDEHYFYIGYRVFDENIVNLPSNEKQGPRDNQREGMRKYHKEIKLDFAMFLISIGSRNFLWEINHDASNHFNDVFIIVPEPEWPLYNSTLAGKSRVIESKAEFIRDHNEIDWDTGETGTFRLAHAVQLAKDSTIADNNARSDKDKGYTGEIRIPWEGLGASMKNKQGFSFKMDGKVIRVIALTRNGDLPVPYHASAKLDSGFAHKQVHNWPAFTLKK